MLIFSSRFISTFSLISFSFSFFLSYFFFFFYHFCCPTLILTIYQSDFIVYKLEFLDILNLSKRRYVCVGDRLFYCLLKYLNICSIQ